MNATSPETSPAATRGSLLFLRLLPLAFLGIAGLMAYKVTRPPQEVSSHNLLLVHPVIPAPFQLYDQNSRLIRLAAYRGRQKLLIVFSPAGVTADQNPQLKWLRDLSQDLESRKIRVMSISALTPYQNRLAMEKVGSFPFSLLSDPTLQTHTQWEAYDPETKSPLPALFLIDRLGMIRFSQLGSPQFLDRERLLKILDLLR